MKKKQAAVLFSLILIVMILGGILLYVLHIYRGTGLALIAEWDKAYEYNGKLLLSEDRTHALRVNTLGKTEFEEVALQTVDLSPFGFEGESLSYYRVDYEESYGIVNTFLYTPDSSYEGLWPVLKPERLVYAAPDGAKYCIHPEDGLCYPMFSDSIEGVDPYGRDVLAFSANGSYALSLKGNVVTVYHTDPMDDSLRVVDVKEVSLKEYGNSAFGAFAGNTTAYFETAKGFVALDCASGKVAPSLLDPEGEYGEVVGRVYAERLDREEKEKDMPITIWSHLLLGEERRSPELEGFSNPKIVSVSPDGTYAALHAESDGHEETLIVSEKRAFSLTSVLMEGEKAERVDFIYENLIYVTVTDARGNILSRCYKICF